MSERDERFLDLYQQYRFEDQRGWYERRHAEFEVAYDQVITLTGLLMVLAGIAGALAAADVGGPKTLWAVLAVIFPALSTALSAYNGLYAFERQAKLYRDAANMMHRARAEAPDLKPEITEAGYRHVLSAYVNKVEGILRTEQGQWGQLISEIEPIEPTAAEP
jgi:ABC-type transport system involved in cytochrome bd biosynthesis fused ATPase/permease subunit